MSGFRSPEAVINRGVGVQQSQCSSLPVEVTAQCSVSEDHADDMVCRLGLLFGQRMDRKKNKIRGTKRLKMVRLLISLRLG